MLLKTLKIGNLSIQVPIIQGGMGVGISLSGLASAVANEGGVGVISAAGLGVIYKNLSKNYLEASILGLKEELSKARQKTQGVIGVNIMVALSNFADLDGDCRESRYYFCRRGNAAEFTLLSAKRQYH